MNKYKTRKTTCDNMEFANLTKTKPFATENDLIEVVVKNIQIFIHRSSDWVVTEEVEIGSGRVDIMLGIPDATNLTTRLSSVTSYDPISGEIAVILHNLYLRKGLRIETISRRTGIKLEIVRQALTMLDNMSLCMKKTETTYVRTSASEEFKNLIAIEGKLSNWKKALEQARRNRLFANYSYVIMDAKHSRPAIKNIEIFRNHDVGLAIACAETGEIHIISKPSCSRPISSMFFRLAKEAMMTRLIEHNVKMSRDLSNVI